MSKIRAAMEMMGRSLPGRSQNISQQVLGKPRDLLEEVQLRQLKESMAMPLKGRGQNISEQVLGRPGSLVQGAKDISKLEALTKTAGIGALAGAGAADMTDGFTKAGSIQNSIFADPEELGRQAAKAQMGLEEIMDKARGKAEELGQAPQLYMFQIQSGYQDEMNKQQAMMAPPEEEGLKPVSLLFSGGGEASFPDLNNDGETTYADILKGRGVYAEGDEVTQNLSSQQDERIKQLYSGATDADLSMLGQMQRNPIPGTPEDYEKKIYILEKEIASQFKEYHGAVEGGFEEQAAARLQGIQEMMTQRLQLKNEYTNQFNSNKVKGMAEGGEAINDELSGMQMSEEDAMAEIQGIAPQAKMIEQLVMAVMQMVQQGIGEQEIIDFLKEQGLDDEDIEDLFTMVMQQMQQGQEDPIANELQEMQ